MATLVMVAALFIIVYVVAKPNPVTGATQLVSLASGLAGIGLGWLFGTGTARGRNR
jgi:NAD(P)H-hydrate repair Nnr-like enzyme with NAD(P)H-hydrate dehydratase domain